MPPFCKKCESYTNLFGNGDCNCIRYIPEEIDWEKRALEAEAKLNVVAELIPILDDARASGKIHTYGSIQMYISDALGLDY